jgi:GNAT superfamily N-acetyltransferase
MTVTVVPITPSDQEFGQVADLFDDYRTHYGQGASPQVTRHWLGEQLAHHHMRIAAAIEADHACGFISTTTVPASLMLATAWSIRDLYVAAHHRRRGIARVLLQHVLTAARSAGAYRVSLQTETDNLPALALYTGLGFQPVTGLRLLNLNLTPDDQ